MSTTVRVSRETHQRLVTLAGATGRQIQAIVEDAVSSYEAQAFWEAFDAGYEDIGEDPVRWADVQAERTGEAAAVADSSDDA